VNLYLKLFNGNVLDTIIVVFKISTTIVGYNMVIKTPLYTSNIGLQNSKIIKISLFRNILAKWNVTCRVNVVRKYRIAWMVPNTEKTAQMILTFYSQTNW